MENWFNKQLFISLVFAALCLSAKAQYFTTGADPHSIKWHQINTDRCKIVYSSVMEREAARLASIMDSVSTYGGLSLLHSPQKFEILLHSRSQYSNGLVTWAPKRMELYTTSSQHVGGQNWIEHLAWHEYRHIVQTDALDKGFTNVLSYIFGQQAIGAVVGLYVPLWLLEGDAVVSETSQSRSGRGRDPHFEQEIRALALENGFYSYDKAYLGSYKNYVPSYYNMGYLLVSNARLKYGKDVWGRVINYTGKNSWSITPFERKIRQIAGHGKIPLYKEAMNDWLAEWKRQDSLTTVTQFAQKTQTSPDYREYTNAKITSDGRLVAQKTGPHITPRFVLIDKNGAESTLHIHGIRDEEPFDIHGDTMVWCELQHDIRWENSTWGDVLMMNIKTRKVRNITNRTRLASPTISPDGQNIATVCTNDSNVKTIRIIDFNGKVVQDIHADGSDIITPVWSEKGDKLFAILQNRDGLRIDSYDFSSRRWTNILPPTTKNICLPTINNGYIYLTSSESGIENIYRVPQQGGELEQLTSSRFGAYSCAVAGDSLIYSNYTLNGYDIVSAPISQIHPTRYSSPMDSVADALSEQESGSKVLPTAATKEYSSEKYSKWHLFNFHSWAPCYIDLKDESVYNGISAFSQNLLGTAITCVGINMASEKSSERYFASFSYKGFFPTIDLKVSYGDEKYRYNGVRALIDDRDKGYLISYNDKLYQFKSKINIGVPLVFNRGKWLRQAIVYTALEYCNRSGYEYSSTPLIKKENVWYRSGDTKKDIAGKYHYNDIQYGIYVHNLHRTSLCDIGTRWGETLEIRFRHTAWGQNIGYCLGAISHLYFPGIGRHHQINVNIGAQQKEAGETYGYAGNYQKQYLYSDFISFPRGCTKRSNDKMGTISINYRLPLLNPDISLGQIAYIKRLSANAFYDSAFGQLTLKSKDNKTKTSENFSLKSCGVELTARTHLFHLSFPFDVGYRYAYLHQTNEHYGEILLSIGLNSAL